jgi:mono/diheme cytochrome c family protein
MRDGREVWSARLSAGTKSNLMTFVGKSGRQYLVATSSGRPDTDIEMVAFALPRTGETPAALRPAAKWPTAPTGSATMASAITRIEDLPQGPGRDEFARACNTCHNISSSTGMRFNLDGWNAIIANMKTRGAQLDDAAQASIARYLATHFGLTTPTTGSGPNGEAE